MTSKQLYTLVVPEGAQSMTEKSVRRNMSTKGNITGTNPIAQSISLDPGEEILHARMSGLHADQMAREFEELFSAPNIHEVPFFGTDAKISRQGYYTLRDVDITPPDPRATGYVSKFEGVMVKKGTKKTHFRSLLTTNFLTDNPFGNVQRSMVSIPSAADKVRWLSKDRKWENPVVQGSVTGQYGDLLLYDAMNSSFSPPKLIYELDYSDEGPMDARLWDTNGFSDKMGSNTIDGVSKSYVQWERVFDPSHQFEDPLVASNTIVRLRLDEANGTITVEEWDTGTSSWVTITLGDVNTSWSVRDVDVRHISPARVDTLVEFTSTEGNEFLIASIKRGYERIQWRSPDFVAGSTATTLVDWLTPTASEYEYSPETDQTVIERTKVFN